MIGLPKTSLIFRLGVCMLMLLGMTACDDTPETPPPKSSEVRKELMRTQLSQKAHEAKSLAVQYFEMRESGKPITLSDANKNKVIALGATLCDLINNDVDADKEQIKQAIKIRTNELISTLSEMGYTNVSIEITKGWDRNDFKQKIHFAWNGTDKKTRCESGAF